MGVRAHTLGFIVDNMARSLAFYRHLGLPIPPEANHQDHVELEDHGALGLAWDTAANIRKADPGWDGHSGRVGIAFECASPEEVNVLYAQIAALGYGHNEPWDAFWGQRYARLRDPDGNRIELFAELPNRG